MKIHIISDMEGVAGICKWAQVDADEGSALYAEGRRLYTGEINAAVRGARAAGATEVVVMDCHGAGGDFTFNSLIAEELDPGCEWVVQSEWTGYTALLEQGCDAALFIGMHAKAGTALGVLNHTVSARAWHDLRFNGVSVGETGINAALCGHWDCPVALVTGDTATCEEARALLGHDLATVATKTGLGRYSARMLHPAAMRDEIEEAARRALVNPVWVPPYKPGSPCVIDVDFATSDEVERYGRKLGVEVTAARSVRSTADDWWTAWSQFFFPDL